MSCIVNYRITKEHEQKLKKKKKKITKTEREKDSCVNNTTIKKMKWKNDIKPPANG